MPWHLPLSRFRHEAITASATIDLAIDPTSAYARLEHGIFVFGAGGPPPAPAAASVRYPDGTIAYNLMAK